MERTGALRAPGGRQRLDPGVYLRLRDRRWILAHGPDTAHHLQAMLTRDLDSLGEDAGRFAALADDRARYLADCWVLRPAGEWWLDAPLAVAERLRERLELFAVASQVTLTDVSADHEVFHCEGSGAQALLHEFGIEVFGGAGGDERCGIHPAAGETLRWTSRSLYGEDGYSVLVPRTRAAALWEKLEGAARNAGFVALDDATALRLRLEAGRPAGGVDIREEHLLPEAGLWGAVSLDKGCYPGQETLQRVSRLGRLQRRLVGLEVAPDGSGSALPPLGVYGPEGKVRGAVSSWSPGRAPGDPILALAWVRHPDDPAGGAWTVRSAAGERSCRLVETPFVPLGRERLVDSITPTPAAASQTEPAPER